jgi:hypothetical protein
MSRDRLREITGRFYGKAQARWFEEFLGACVPCDSVGPILTEQTFEELVARASGIRRTDSGAERPTIRKKAA